MKLFSRIVVVLAALAVAGLVAALVPVDGNGAAGTRAPQVAPSSR